MAASRAHPAPRTAEQIAVTALGPRPLPALQATKARRAPASAQIHADNGLAITAVRRPSSPMIELRLRIPFGGRTPLHAARAELLAETILLGTQRRTRQQVDADLAMVGAQLSAHVTPQQLQLSGSTLAPGLGVLLDILADVLTAAAYRGSDIARERDRLVEHLSIAAAQPATIARGYLQRLRFGDHPAAWELPEAELVAGVGPAAVRGLHRRAVLPRGSRLILVGDLRPARAAEDAARALAAWADTGAAAGLSAPRLTAPGPVIAYHRPGSVQSLTRLTAPGVLRTDPGYAAAQLATMVFGGYFSSRLVENLREDKGFTYHAHASIEFWPECAAMTISYDTAGEVAAAALVETRHELGRIAVTAPSPQEIEAARNYAIGSLASSLATQAGYASMLTSLAGSGLGADWLRHHQANLAAVTAEDVCEAAARLFAPAAVSGVIIGDLEATAATLGRLDGMEIERV